jgi:alkanesulfonate monooxygenase SsuD/methylene tetrahydromethanopterin reductase-like flavin-dependent oxidoreductase (luciferase family)
MVFSVPWLDGPTALVAVLAHSGDAMLATTVSNPVVRGPVPLAKTLAAIDRLSGGRLVIAVGPGSSKRDYQVVGLSYEERWKRLDEVIPVLRSLLRRDAEPGQGRFYSTEELTYGPTLRSRTGRPSGSAVGARMSDDGEQRASPTVGSPPPTTQPPRGSPTPGTGVPPP